MDSRIGRKLAALAVLVPFVAGCSGLELVQDRRVSFVSPRADSVNHLPVTITWTAKDISTASPDGVEYAVFIDKSPLKVGKSLSSLLPAHVVPTAALLANINVYLTRDPSVVIDSVPSVSHDHGSRQRHTATIVLLDAAGKRQTESAWSRDFDVKASS